MSAIWTLVFLHFYIVITKCEDNSIRYKNTSELRFCSFFNNRAPQPQPTLTNCTWFQKNSCCLQHEIDVSFLRVKPLIGATEDCQKYTNYLMCYICAPDQNEFYKKERLTICESFCNLLYEFCKFAILKGNQIKQLYGSGRDFCLSRRFLIGQNSNCFSIPHILTPMTNKGNRWENSLKIHILVFLIFVSCYMASSAYNCWNHNMTKSFHFLEKCSLLKCLLFMIFLSECMQYCKGQIVPIEDISNLGKSISSFINEFSQTSVVYPKYEESITSHSMDKVEGSTIVKMIQTELSSFFTLRKASIREVAKQIADFHEGYNGSTDNFDINHNHFSGLLQMKKPYSKEGKFVKSIKSEESWIGEEALKQVDPHAERTFFATKEGKYLLHPHQTFKTFEPRVQPWYLGVKEAPSNVILIVDSSYSHNFKRFGRTKEAVLLLLSSLAHHQRLAVISSSSLAWNSTGKVHDASASVLGCVKDRLIRATLGNIEMLTEAVRSIKPLGGSDHSGAFFKAFNLLKKQQTSHQKYLECKSVILFVTDGEEDEHLRCSPGYYQYTDGNTRRYQQGEICQHDTDGLLEIIQKLQRKLPGAKANVFTFLTSHARRSDVSFCGKLACQNNGAFSRIYEDENLFSQMSPFFDYIRTREYSYEPIVTGPYKSSVDGRLVITFSAPVVAKGSNSILGVVGMDVLFSLVENLLEEYHEYLYLVNLVDGSAILHPLIKKSYEDSKEWNSVPLIDLEMEDSNHSKEFPEVVRKLMQRMNEEVIVKTNASEAFEVEEGRALWKPVDSILHMISYVPGTHFGFGIKNVYLKDQDHHGYFLKVNKSPKLHDLESDMKNYYHRLFGSLLLPSDLLSELNMTRNHPTYPGVSVSFEHSSIILMPPAFCWSSFAHLHKQGKIFDIQKYINVSFEDNKGKAKLLEADDDDEDDENGEDDEDDEEDDNNGIEDGCMITERARQDIIISLPLEKDWKDVRMIASSIKSLYIASMSGVIRHFPGLQVPDGMIHHPLRYPWFVQAMLNPGKIVITHNKASFSGASNIVTMSRVVDSDHKVVLAADLLKDELHQKLLHTMKSNICCPPHDHNSSCNAKCYLVSDQGEIVISLSGGLDRLRTQDLHKQFPFIYQTLAKHHLVVLVKITELRKNCSSPNNLAGANDSSRACMAVKMKSHIRSNYLEEIGGTFARSSDGTSSEEPCHRGIFFVSSIQNTNLFLLTLFDYNDDKHSPDCINKIMNLQKRFELQLNPICPDHENYYISRTNSTTCPKKRFISLYCRYNSVPRVTLNFYAFVSCVISFLILRQGNDA